MRVVYPGHSYALANLRANGETLVQFSQDAPHPVVSGTSCQEVLRALIDRVHVLDREVPWPGNVEIVRHLRQSIALFEARALLRKVEKGELAIETCPIAEDGHLIITGE